MKTRDQSELVNIGRINTAVGLRGEVRVILYADDSENLKEGKVLLLQRGNNSARSTGSSERGGSPARSLEGSGRGSYLAQTDAPASRNAHSADSATAPASLRAKCLGVRYQGTKGAGGIPVIKIDGVTDRNAAEALRGMEIYIEAAALEKLPAGQHYVRDLIGYEVYDRASGRVIGTLHDVIQNTAQNVLDITACADSECEVASSASNVSESAATASLDTGESAPAAANLSSRESAPAPAKRKQILVPAVDAFLKHIDDDRRVIELDLIPGFLD